MKDANEYAHRQHVQHRRSDKNRVAGGPPQTEQSVTMGSNP